MILEMLSYPFMQRAIIVGLLVSLSASLLGVSLVLRRFSMIGDGLSHVGFGALAIASVFSLSPMPVDEGTPVIYGITIEDCHAEGSRASAGMAVGLPESPIRDLSIRDSSFAVAPDASEPIDRSDMYLGLPDPPSRGFRLRNAEVAAMGKLPFCQDTGTATIIGKKGHPEVLALCGARREAAVVSSPEDVRNLSPGSYKAVLQTTFPSPSPILEEAERQGVRIELLNAICPASGERRKALRDIIPSVDAIVVIGSAFSSNTAELLSIARESGKPSYLVSEAEEIPSEIYSFGTVGITAGASAPDSLVDLVVRKLESGSDKPRL